jgi:hypothetical protein
MEKYATLKERGLATLLKTENSCAISYAQFDKDTGERVEDKVLSFNVEELKKEKEGCQNRIIEIDRMLEEIDNTPLAEPVLADLSANKEL